MSEKSNVAGPVIIVIGIFAMIFSFILVAVAAQEGIDDNVLADESDFDSKDGIYICRIESDLSYHHMDIRIRSRTTGAVLMVVTVRDMWDIIVVEERTVTPADLYVDLSPEDTSYWDITIEFVMSTEYISDITVEVVSDQPSETVLALCCAIILGPTISIILIIIGIVVAVKASKKDRKKKPVLLNRAPPSRRKGSPVADRYRRTYDVKGRIPERDPSKGSQKTRKPIVPPKSRPPPKLKGHTPTIKEIMESTDDIKPREAPLPPGFSDDD